MKDAPEVSWHVKFDSQNLKHSGDLARWSTIAHRHRPSPMKVRLNPNITNLATLGIIMQSILEFPDKMKIPSGSSIAVGQVKKKQHNWEVATVWIDTQSEKGKYLAKKLFCSSRESSPVQNPVQSRIQSSPESRSSPGFITSPFQIHCPKN